MFPLGFPSANRTGLFIRCIFMDADISELNMFVVFDYLALEQKQPNLFPQIMFLYRLNSWKSSVKCSSANLLNHIYL